MKIDSQYKIIFKPIEKNKNIKDEFVLDDLLSKFTDNKTSGLLIGQVQSGKTNQIINIIIESLNKYNFNIILFLHGTTNNLANQQEERLQKEGIDFLKSQNIDLNNEDYYNHINKSKKILICCLKNKTHIEKIFELLQNSSIIKNKKILIIDDESDFASVNTAKKNESPKTINNLINNIYEKLIYKNGGLLKVTATPFANILNKNEKVDFIFSMKTSDDYCGILKFNSLRNFFIPISKDHNDNFEKIIYKSLVVYLSQSLLMFNETNNNESSFLINVKSMLDEHSKFESYLKSIILKNLNDLINDVFEYINNVLKKEIDFVKIQHFFNDNVKDFKNISINCSNSKNEKFIEKKMSIIIGGVFLSRGNTFKNLITELLWQENNLVIDVLWQKARWLGYRKSKLEYMNLLTSNEIIDVFKKSNILINLFWETENGAELDVDFITTKLVEYEKHYFKGILYTNESKRK